MKLLTLILATPLFVACASTPSALKGHPCQAVVEDYQYNRQQLAWAALGTVGSIRDPQQAQQAKNNQYLLETRLQASRDRVFATNCQSFIR